jgi:hypothetical protein
MQSIIIMFFITVVLSFACGVTYGQTFSEWWQQKKTRIKYLRQQAAALETLKETMEDGYNQAIGGIDSIETITGQELDLHQIFLESLKSVKRSFKECPELVASRGLDLTLMQRLLTTMHGLPDDPEFKNNKTWFKVYILAIAECIEEDLRDMEALTADGSYEMKDADRYERIRNKAAHVRAIYESGMSFLTEVEEWLINRQSMANEEFVRRHL